MPAFVPPRPQSRHRTAPAPRHSQPMAAAPPEPQICSSSRPRLRSTSHNLGRPAPSLGTMPPKLTRVPCTPAACPIAEWNTATVDPGATQTRTPASLLVWGYGDWTCYRHSHPGVRVSRICAQEWGSRGQRATALGDAIQQSPGRCTCPARVPSVVSSLQGGVRTSVRAQEVVSLLRALANGASALVTGLFTSSDPCRQSVTDALWLSVRVPHVF